MPDSPRGPWAPSGPRAPVGPASPWGERNGVRWGTVPQFPLPQSYLHLSAQPLPSNRGLRGSRELRQGRRVPGGTGKCGGAAQAGGAPKEPLWGSAEYWGVGSKQPHTYRGSSRAGEAVIASSTLGGDGSYGGGGHSTPIPPPTALCHRATVTLTAAPEGPGRPRSPGSPRGPCHGGGGTVQRLWGLTPHSVPQFPFCPPPALTIGPGEPFSPGEPDSPYMRKRVERG